jgi:hypothetical protein
MDRVRGRAPRGGRPTRGRTAVIAAERARTRPRPLLGGLLALAIALMLAVGASSASAVIVHLPNGRTVSYQPVRGSAAAAMLAQPFASKNLVYHGGPVMTSNTNYTFYWAPSGSAPYAAGYQSGVNRYMEDLAHDSGGNQNVDSVATQYTNEAGEPAAYDSHFAGAIIDTHPYPKNGCEAAAICLTDEQIQAEIKRWVTSHGLPQGLTHEYFLLTPPGVESCFTSAGTECSAGIPSGAYCAYHGAISAAGGSIIYANDPYVVGNPGCDSTEHPNGPSDAALLGGLSHEHNESITDPELNAWWGPGGEIGDKCRTFEEASEYGEALGIAPDGSRYNQLINDHEYFYQQEWSNLGSTCMQRSGPTRPTVKKLAPKAGAAAGGTVVTVTGTGFSGTTTVSFGGVPAASFTVSSSTAITVEAPAGTSGTVDVTVTNPAGTSPVVAADHFKYGVPIVTAVAPKAGSKAGGTPVSITGSGFAVGTSTVFRFGKVAATSVNCASSTSCTAVSPAATKAGTVDVIATVPGAKGKKNAPADHFTYS